MAILVDTNVLIFSIQRDHAWQEESLAALAVLFESDEVVCVSLQNVAEFWNICTRPAGKNGLGLSVQETEQQVRRLESLLTVLHDDSKIYPEWRKLIFSHDVKGIQVHDARLVASMRVHNVTRILTYNPQDFKRYNGISILHPRDVS